MGPVPPPDVLPIVLHIPGGLNPERTIFIEGEIHIDASWFSISLQCSSSLRHRDNVPFHLEISFSDRNTTYKATSFMSDQWDEETSIVKSRALQEKLRALKIATDSVGVKVSIDAVNNVNYGLKTIKDADEGKKETSSEAGPSNERNTSDKGAKDVKIESNSGQTGTTNDSRVNSSSDNESPKQNAEKTVRESRVHADDNVEIKRDPRAGNTIYECESKSDNSVKSNKIYNDTDNEPTPAATEDANKIGVKGTKDTDPKDNLDKLEASEIQTPKHTNSKEEENECTVSSSRGKTVPESRKISVPKIRATLGSFSERLKATKWDDVMDSKIFLRMKCRRQNSQDASLLSIDASDFCDEELHHLDLSRGDEFKIALECLENGYLVTLNEELFCAYPHKTDYRKVLYMVIDGDVDLGEVEVGGGEGPDRTLVMELYQACKWSGDVVVLTDDNFASQVLNSEDVWMVDAYTAWCPACAHLKPEWEDAARVLHGMVKLGATDCDRNEQLTDDLNILYYPMILYFPEGRKTFRSALVYEGRHRSDCIVPWALQKMTNKSGMPIGIIPSKSPPRTLRKKRQGSLRRRGYKTGGIGYQDVPKKSGNSDSPWHTGICGESARREVSMLEHPALEAAAPDAPPPATRQPAREQARCMLL